MKNLIQNAAVLGSMLVIAVTPAFAVHHNGAVSSTTPTHTANGVVINYLSSTYTSTSTKSNDNSLGNFGGVYSPGYVLNDVSTGSNMAGINWPEVTRTGNGTTHPYVYHSGDFTSGTGVTISGPSVTSVGVNFEVLHSIYNGADAPNPNIWIVLEDTTGDYYQTTVSKPAKANFLMKGRASNTDPYYDLFSLSATPAKFYGGAITNGTIRNMAVAFIGTAALSDGGPASLSQIYMTNPNIVTSSTTYIPNSYDAAGVMPDFLGSNGADTTFDFNFNDAP